MIKTNGALLQNEMNLRKRKSFQNKHKNLRIEIKEITSLNQVTNQEATELLIRIVNERRKPHK